MVRVLEPAKPVLRIEYRREGGGENEKRSGHLVRVLAAYMPPLRIEYRRESGGENKKKKADTRSASSNRKSRYCGINIAAFAAGGCKRRQKD